MKVKTQPEELRCMWCHSAGSDKIKSARVGPVLKKGRDRVLASPTGGRRIQGSFIRPTLSAGSRSNGSSASECGRMMQRSGWFCFRLIHNIDYSVLYRAMKIVPFSCKGKKGVKRAPDAALVEQIPQKAGFVGVGCKRLPNRFYGTIL